MNNEIDNIIDMMKIMIKTSMTKDDDDDDYNLWPRRLQQPLCVWRELPPAPLRFVVIISVIFIIVTIVIIIILIIIFVINSIKKAIHKKTFLRPVV